MLSIYILSQLLYLLSPQHVAPLFTDEILPHQQAQTITVSFDQLDCVVVGNPVLSQGVQVGSVASVNAENGKFNVVLELKNSLQLSSDTVALIQYPLSNVAESSRTVVELLPPNNGLKQKTLVKGESLVGYSSFEAFWSADLKKKGVAPGAFRVVL